MKKNDFANTVDDKMKINCEITESNILNYSH